MNDAARFKFSGRDSMAQFMGWIIIFQPAGWIPHNVWYLGGPTAFGIFTLAVVVIIAGLRASILITPSRVMIVRKWLFIPYWRHTGRTIENVEFGGDCGDPEGAMGVVVKLDGRELHIGSGKTMHYLYSALQAVR